MSAMDDMDEAHRRDAAQERALGTLLDAFHKAKMVYSEQGTEIPWRFVRAEADIEHERNYLQAVWN